MWPCYGVWHFLFVYFVSQCIHACTEPALHGLDFFLEIFLWKLRAVTMSTKQPAWAEGLQKCGTYFDGYVDNPEEILELHQRDTVTTWGIRRSQNKMEAHKEADKENSTTYNAS